MICCSKNYTFPKVISCYFLDSLTCKHLHGGKFPSRIHVQNERVRSGSITEGCWNTALNIQLGSHIAHWFQHLTFPHLSLCKIIIGQRPGAFMVSLESLKSWKCHLPIPKVYYTWITNVELRILVVDLLNFRIFCFCFGCCCLIVLELQRVVKSLGSWPKLLGIKCQFCHFLPVWS